MPRRNREYKRSGQHKDDGLFIITCEGAKREYDYFRALAKKYARIRIKILGPVGSDQASSPAVTLDRAKQYVRSEYSLRKGDSVWVVCDTDRWLRKTLHHIARYCRDHEAWNVAISNPCFEVWLHHHHRPLAVVPVLGCQQLKRAVNDLVPGGHDSERYIHHILNATASSKMADVDHDGDIPKKMQTKVWRLGEALIPFLPE